VSNFDSLNVPISSLYLLAAPSTPEEARDEVIERGAKGETLNHKEVKAIVAKRKATAPMLNLKTHRGQEVAYPEPAAKATFNRTNEHISWAAWSWNPVTGCLHGCKYCYAREIALRFTNAYPAGFDPVFHHERLDAPANSVVPGEAGEDPRLKRVFVCSTADLYGKWVPDEWIEQVHASCISNPQWDYLMLTKFPRRYVGRKLPPTAWIGTSVDEQKRMRLAEEAFRQVKDVRVKWLSLEPLLAPLEFSDLSMFDWIVIGAQSATNQPDGPVKGFAPPYLWVHRIVAQAIEAGCRVYLKPNLLGISSPQSPGMKLLQEEPKAKEVATPSLDLLGEVVALPARPALLKADIAAYFDRFWSVYPKKVGKKAALRAFERAVNNDHVDPERIIAAAARYASEKADEDPHYIKHPQGWINDGRFDDETATNGATIIDQGGNIISTARTSKPKNRSYLDVAAQMFGSNES
jgi:protein gp37